MKIFTTRAIVRTLALAAFFFTAVVGDAQEAQSQSPQEVLRHSVSKLPQYHLRKAASVMLDSLVAYAPPSPDEEPRGTKPEETICLNARDVFFHLRQYQVIHGHKQAMQIRPVIGELFRCARDKLAWIMEERETLTRLEERGIDVELLQRIFRRISGKYDLLQSDDPITIPGPLHL